MKDLSAQTGIVSDADFLNGKIVNGQTLVGEGINQDVIQFFQKLMNLAGLTPSGNYDNETNGYQTITALSEFVRSTDWSTIASLINLIHNESDSNRGYISRFVEIGDWDMDTNATKNVAHSLGPDWKNIRGINVIIRNDNDTAYIPLSSYDNSGLNGGVDLINSTDIVLRRAETADGGSFDGAPFSTTPYNRGYIKIDFFRS